jgi:hypothetical protein
MDGSIIEAAVGLLASAFGVYVLSNRERLAKENNEVIQRWLGAQRVSSECRLFMSL